MSTGQQRRKEETGKLVKEVFCDAYLFYVKYHGKPVGPEMWEAVTKEYGDLVEKHHGSNICGRLALAVIAQLEEETR